MANFYQHGQVVNNQYNANEIQVGGNARFTPDELDAMLEVIIDQLSGGRGDSAVVSQLEAARKASARGDRRRLVTLLNSALKLLPPTAAAATGLAAIVNAVTSVA